MINLQELRKPHNDQILLLSKNISEKETKIAEYQKRVLGIQAEAKKISEEIECLKNDQKAAIVAGEDHFAIGHELITKTLDAEAFTGAKKMLDEMIADEKTAIIGFQEQTNECIIELLKLDTVPLVEKLNQANEIIAGIYKEYERLAWDIGKIVPKHKNFGGRLPSGLEMLRQVVYVTKGIIGMPIRDVSKVFTKIPGAEQNTRTEPELYYSCNRDSLTSQIKQTGTIKE